MNLNNYTIKAQEIIQQAQQLAFNNGNSNIETNHLLKALLDEEDSPVDFLLKKNKSMETTLDATLMPFVNQELKKTGAILYSGRSGILIQVWKYGPLQLLQWKVLHRYFTNH